MAKVLKALAAGLGSIGQSVQQMEEQERKDKKEAAALARDKEIREENRRRADRQYELQKTAADQAAAIGRQQQAFNEIKLNTQHITNAFSISNGDPKTTIQALNQYGNTPQKLRFDGYDKDGNILMTEGRYVSDGKGGFEKGEDGSFKFIPAVDKDNRPIPPRAVPRAGFNSMVMQTVKPEIAFALHQAKQMGIVQAETAGQVAEKTGQKDVRAADVDLKEAQAENLRAGGGKKYDEFKGIDGKLTKMTTAKINSLTNDSKAYTGEFGSAVSAPQAHRINQMSESDAAKKDVRDIAELVAKGQFSPEDAATALVDEYDIPVGVAEYMLTREVTAIKNNEPSWWDNFWNTKKAQRAKKAGS